MGYIQKFFQTKKGVELFIEEKGMEAAIKEFGLNKLVMFKLMNQYEGTELYYYEHITIHKVYDNKGVCLGDITPLMSPYYKKLGYFFGPCKNGNIILSKLDEERLIKTYSVFDKNGKNIISYGKYFNHEFVENGVALMGVENEVNPLVTIHYDGSVKTQPFSRIDKDYKYGGYELQRIENGKMKMYHVDEKVVKDMVDGSTEIGTIEKGIE